MINAGWLGVDLSRYNLEDPLSNIKSNAMLAQVEALNNSTTESGKEWRLKDLLELLRARRSRTKVCRLTYASLQYFTRSDRI